MLTARKPPPGSRWTPGVTASSELKSRPLSGMLSMRSLSTLLFSLSENSTSGLTPSTVMVSDCAPTSSLKSTFATALTATWTSRATVLKPASSAWTRYTHTANSGKLNPPCVSVTAVRVAFVVVHTAVTVAPGSTPPVVSVIVPEMSPVVFCANPLVAVAINVMTPTSSLGHHPRSPIQSSVLSPLESSLT